MPVVPQRPVVVRVPALPQVAQAEPDRTPRAQLVVHRRITPRRVPVLVVMAAAEPQVAAVAVTFLGPAVQETQEQLAGLPQVVAAAAAVVLV
jgi:hypothetical protein